MARENRKLHRRHLVFYLDTIHRDTLQSLGRLVDITGEGLMLVSEKSLETGLRLPVRLEFPVEIDGETHLDLTVMSVWCRKDKNPDLWGIGLQMIETNPLTDAKIDKLIDFLGFQD